MSSVIDKLIVLSLNRNWERIGHRTVRQAIISMMGGDDQPPALGMDLTVNEDGELENCIPTAWDDWVKLPVRDCDLAIQTSRGEIRAPTVILNANYAKMPIVSPRLTPGRIFERDGLIDQYTGEKLSRREASLDHVTPRSRGGKDSWENLVTCHKKRNQEKGNRLNHEIGLRLLRAPKAPPTVPKSFLIKEALHRDHIPFIR